MVKANDSWLFQQDSAWYLPNLNHMSTLLPPGQQNGLPSCMNPCTFSANVAFPGFLPSALPGFKTCQANGAHGSSQCLPPLVESSLSTPNPYLKESQSAFVHGLGTKTTPNDVTGSVRKRFLIFDQCGNQTRVFVSPFGSSSQSPTVATMKVVHACHLSGEKQKAMIDQISPTKPISQEKMNEDRILEGSEIHEDTEEINALLYSSDDDEDEVTSTGHSPFAINGSVETYEQVGEITQEVASSDGSTKRQRLVDGGYKKSSLVRDASSVKLDGSCKFDTDAQSSCANGSIQGKYTGSILGNKWSKKDKIHETLRILRSIIPGSKSKDPLLIIDETINYLKFLKGQGQGS